MMTQQTNYVAVVGVSTGLTSGQPFAKNPRTEAPHPGPLSEEREEERSGAPYQAAQSGAIARQMKWLSDGWRNKGLELASRVNGQLGDAVQELLKTGAEELETELARLEERFKAEGWKLTKQVSESKIK